MSAKQIILYFQYIDEENPNFSDIAKYLLINKFDKFLSQNVFSINYLGVYDQLQVELDNWGNSTNICEFNDDYLLFNDVNEFLHDFLNNNAVGDNGQEIEYNIHIKIKDLQNFVDNLHLGKHIITVQDYLNKSYEVEQYKAINSLPKVDSSQFGTPTITVAPMTIETFQKKIQSLEIKIADLTNELTQAKTQQKTPEILRYKSKYNNPLIDVAISISADYYDTLNDGDIPPKQGTLDDEIAVRYKKLTGEEPAKSNIEHIDRFARPIQFKRGGQKKK
ncbi:hypothetical protein [Vitreoscilla stercoraria]|uniref:Uncharacterized protein n=1 Tax=Vitreoscilla stercoraria TaxID=61 RepID=A0ABY4ECT8_VITST|nr:hypothetical protein [Vitreoscilla stercoraria]UOO93163.1 hypothetical protein LVJ81_03780 [Vitreoscilla stercoraria]